MVSFWIKKLEKKAKVSVFIQENRQKTLDIEDSRVSEMIVYEMRYGGLVEICILN